MIVALGRRDGGTDPIANAQASQQQGKDEIDIIVCVADQYVQYDEAAIILAFLANLEPSDASLLPPLKVIALEVVSDLLPESGHSPACDNALLADATTSFVVKESSTISHQPTLDDNVNVLSTFGVDECAEARNTTISPDLVSEEYAIISTFLTAPQEL
ncbi:hypothetical protein KP509_14G084600 [Ceratopteris richardii]|uniref:Uncharacterized protein n=1 Tax=Ceratopteris richardii TaxID=49495 RepID=A0A8T2T9V6_CERRI|nr:hypothetical protein KP509_14G084600 [Ceratopteris richardii]